MSDDPWLVLIDPQRIFADPSSEWAAPQFETIVTPVRRLAEAHEGRVLITRWLPGTGRSGSWREYFQRWPFADRPDDDPLFDLVDELAGLATRPTVDASTFGKWPALEAVTGPVPHLILTGVATDCCVIATALAAADAGAHVTVVADACAGSSPENQTAALRVLGLYEPQITVRTADAVLTDGR